MTTIHTDKSLALTPLSGTIGAVVDGIDVGASLGDDAVAGVRRALVDHKVLVFREQAHVGPAELARFAAAFGAVTRAHPVLPGLDGFPEVLEVDATRSRSDPRYRDEYENDTWHADVTFMAAPPLGSVLQAKVLPPAGGDTMFADCEAAYRSLSPPFRRLVDELAAVHDGRAEFAGFLAANPEGGEWEGARFTALEPIVHPVVRTHPESGRRSLFVNPTFTTSVVGLSKDESAALLSFLYGRIPAPEHVLRWRWSVGDIVFWDNRSTLHHPVRDYGEHHRLMHRVTIRGDRPF